MTKTKKHILVCSAFFLPSIAFAQVTIETLIDDITSVVVSIIPILLGLAVLAFFWGLVKFINHAGDEKTLEEGKQLMIWGMIAIFVMVALWGILGWLQQEFGLNSGADLGTLPSQPDNIP